MFARKDNPITFKGIDHVVLRVTDIERSLAFYGEILGLALERVIEGAQIYQLRCGRNLIDLVVAPLGSPLAPSEQRGMEHLCLMVHGDSGRISRPMPCPLFSVPRSFMAPRVSGPPFIFWIPMVIGWN